MVSYVFLSAFLAVLGIAVVTVVTVIAVRRGRERRELYRRRNELDTESQLEDYLSRLDQAESAEDIDRLGDHDNER